MQGQGRQSEDRRSQSSADDDEDTGRAGRPQGGQNRGSENRTGSR
jgi:hypothetical protein